MLCCSSIAARRSARFPGFYRRTSRFFQRVRTLYATASVINVTTTTKTMASRALPLLALALATQLSVEAFSQYDNSAWNARFADLSDSSACYVFGRWATVRRCSRLDSTSTAPTRVPLSLTASITGSGASLYRSWSATACARPTTASSRRRRAATCSRCRPTSGRTAVRAPAVKP